MLGDWLDIDNGKGEILPLPIAEIGMEDALLIRRLLAKSPVTIGFSYQNQISGPVPSNSVIAEIRGSDKADEWILVGAISTPGLRNRRAGRRHRRHHGS